MKKLKIIMIALLSILICSPTIYRLNMFENSALIVRGIVIDAILNTTKIASIDIEEIIQLILSLSVVALFIAMCCNYKKDKEFVILCSITLTLTGVFTIWTLALSMQIRSYMNSAGVIANIIPLAIFIVTLIIFVVGNIKHLPRRPSKTERMRAQIDELQKQVDELKKGE